jgi:hypothetical protein
MDVAFPPFPFPFRTILAVFETLLFIISLLFIIYYLLFIIRIIRLDLEREEGGPSAKQPFKNLRFLRPFETGVREREREERLKNRDWRIENKN